MAATTHLVNASTHRIMNRALFTDLPACRCGSGSMMVVHEQHEAVGDQVNITCPNCALVGQKGADIHEAIRLWKMALLIS